VRYRKLFSAVALATILSLLAVIIPASPALAAEDLDVSPSKGEIGDRPTVSGDGYGADRTVYIFFSSQELEEGDDIEGLDIYEQKSTISSSIALGDSSDGEISRTFTILEVLDEGEEEEDVHAGDYFFYTTYTTTGNIQAVAEFTVTGIKQIDPEEGPVGTEVEIEGVGFDGNDDIVVTFGDDEIDIESGDDDTDSSGDFDCSIIIPESTAGEHTITVEDENDHIAEATFTVESAMTMDPTEGSIGSQVTVSGTGYGGSQDVTITLDDTQVTIADTDSSGSFTATFTVPQVEAGTYDVEAEDEDGNSATASFTMSADVTLSTATSAASPGYVGMEMTITGMW